MNFFAYKYKEFTKLIIGIFSIVFITLYLIINNFDADIFNNQNDLYVCAGISFLLGISFGWCFIYSLSLCSMILGAFAGCVVTQFFTISLILLIHKTPKYFYWVFLVVFVCGLVYIGYKNKKHFFIIFSCFLGSYSIIRVFYFIKLSLFYF